MSVCFVQLGRYGDIINMLPMVRHVSVTECGGSPVPVVVSTQYATVLLGASYAVADKVHYAFFEIGKGLAYAREKYEMFYCSQVWGKGYLHPYAGHGVMPYNMAAWESCGFPGYAFHDTKTYPLIFDMRAKDREDFLVRRVRRGQRRPLVLYNVNCGLSSPFPSRAIVQEALERRWNGMAQVVDLCQVKASRIYDLLGLFDAAAVLVTTDTSALHLAGASGVPVIAFLNPDNWKGSKPRCKVAMSLTYNEVVPHMKDINAMIGYLVSEAKRVFSLPAKPKPDEPNIPTD